MASSDKAAALHAELQRQVAELVSGEDWQRALAFAARFHRYSFGNQQLIAHQMPSASLVAGFNRWHDLGRYVRKGERGIAILAPMTFRKTIEGQEGDVAEVVGLRGFRVVHVFDVSQTEGQDIPQVAPKLLEGSGEAWDALARLVEAEGFTLERGNCNPAANGVTMFATKTVRVRDDVSPTQATKTLCHELAHVLMHRETSATRDLVEVEAESVAYVVLNALGFTTAEYSLPYVATWANGDPKLIAATGERVVSQARAILDALDRQQAFADAAA